MAPIRPPSEQGVEYQLLDKITELIEKLDQPIPIIINTNGGGDQLAVPNPYPAMSGYTWQTPLTTYGNAYGYIEIKLWADSIELILIVNGQYLWQRKLYWSK
jgi:hypothetical protein